MHEQTADEVFGQALWIGRGQTVGDWRAVVRPAPMLRRRFELPADARELTLHVCGLGYHELYLDSQRIGDRVLEPVVTQYDKRVAYVTHQLPGVLPAGRHMLGVILGNGWYNCHTSEVWHFDKACWRDEPKLLLRLVARLADGSEFSLVSDTQWQVADSPIVFDGLRNGEFHDARLDRPGWSTPDADDAAWGPAAAVAPPPGVLEPQQAPPCRVIETLPSARDWSPEPGVRVFDVGRNIAGWARIAAQGAAGDVLTLRYAERLEADGRVDQTHIGVFIKSGLPQTDRYTLGGLETEQWEPRFTYHGFQYVQVEGPPQVVASVRLEGRVVGTDFARIGWFDCSDARLNALYSATLNAYRGNFVGIPTDCPHREKNGWTGDAALASEFGLLTFDAADAYEQWLVTLADAQRPSGQLCGIAPTAGWGYNWGSGPAWDIALFWIPWQIKRYRGRTSIIQRLYPGMCRYIDYCRRRAPDHIARFGLGDWCHPEGEPAAPPELVTTAYYHLAAHLLSRFARQLGHDVQASGYERLAADIRDAFNRAFHLGEGRYADDQLTALGCALHFNLVEDRFRQACARRLAQAVEARGYKAQFGIIGALTVPRALAEQGYVEQAMRIITQPEQPGWMHWLSQGATTLWEDWHGASSRNHIMYGDVTAWLINVLGGISPDPAAPGMESIVIRPRWPTSLQHVHARHIAPCGPVDVRWERKHNQVHLRIEIPQGARAVLRLPNQPDRSLPGGKHEMLVGDGAST